MTWSNDWRASPLFLVAAAASPARSGSGKLTANRVAFVTRKAKNTGRILIFEIPMTTSCGDLSAITCPARQGLRSRVRLRQFYGHPGQARQRDGADSPGAAAGDYAWALISAAGLAAKAPGHVMAASSRFMPRERRCDKLNQMRDDL